MSALKKLAGQTAVYGLSSILGRVINYLLVPLYTGIFAPADFGKYSELYAYIAIFLVILTIGMETTLFHFSRKQVSRDLVFSTGFGILGFVSGVFGLFVMMFSSTLAHMIGYPENPEYIRYTGLILVLDVMSALPLAKLRQENRALPFAMINLLSIAINIGLNLFFLVYCHNIYEATEGHTSGIVKLLYKPEIGIGYIFIANLVASLFKLVFCMPYIYKVPLKMDRALARDMLSYGWPLMISGLGFIINERLDLILLKYCLPLDADATMEQIGIYSGCYKLAIFLSLFIQAYRFAAEPFFFNQAGAKDMKRNYAKAMNLFVLICCIAFLIITFYIDFFKLFIRDAAYYPGLKIVPVILIANIFLGIYVNLSMWYKLAGKTLFGVWFSLAGAFITIALNILLIPRFGYMASAWTTLLAYLVMALLSYYTGKKYYPIPYNKRKILFYLFFAIFLYGISALIPISNPWIMGAVNTILFIPYLFAAVIIEPSLRNFFLKRLQHGRKN